MCLVFEQTTTVHLVTLIVSTYGFDQNDAFADTQGILSGTFRRMNNMASKQGCRWLWYMVFLIVVFWFFIIVWWFRR